MLPCRRAVAGELAAAVPEDGESVVTALLSYRGRDMRKKLRCLLGFHRWVTGVSDGQRYLTCRDCGAYGGDPPAPWKYDN